MKRYLEAGRLNSPRGLNGELRFDCWCDGVEFLQGVKTLYLDPKGEKPIGVKSFNLRLSTVIFDGFEDRGRASQLTGRTVWFDREDIGLPDGVCFNDDLIGAPVFDVTANCVIGVLTRIDEGVASDYYYITGDKNYLIPAVSEFVLKKDPKNGITVRLIDGFEA